MPFFKRDICHGTIDSNLVGIQFQPDQNSSTMYTPTGSWSGNSCFDLELIAFKYNSEQLYKMWHRLHTIQKSQNSNPQFT